LALARAACIRDGPDFGRTQRAVEDFYFVNQSRKIAAAIAKRANHERRG
jgi:hypothetical protein